jgi:hypothetical protein
MKQADAFRPLLGHYGVFPDADFAMENPTRVFIGPNDLAPEVPHPDMTVTDFAGRKLHDVNAMQPPRHRDAMQFLNEKRIVLPERWAVIVRYVSVAVRKLVKALKRRRVNAEVNAI